MRAIRARGSSAHSVSFAVGRHRCWFAAYVATVPPMRGRGGPLRLTLIAPSAGYATLCASYLTRKLRCLQSRNDRPRDIAIPVVWAAPPGARRSTARQARGCDYPIRLSNRGTRNRLRAMRSDPHPLLNQQLF
jgi:hypothetical protein